MLLVLTTGVALLLFNAMVHPRYKAKSASHFSRATSNVFFSSLLGPDISEDGEDDKHFFFGTAIDVFLVFTITLVLQNFMIAFMSDAYEEAKQVAKARWCFSEFVQLEDHIASMHTGRGWRVDEYLFPRVDTKDSVGGNGSTSIKGVVGDTGEAGRGGGGGGGGEGRGAEMAGVGSGGGGMGGVLGSVVRGKSNRVAPMPPAVPLATPLANDTRKAESAQ